jgi:hypothetical protein
MIALAEVEGAKIGLRCPILIHEEPDKAAVFEEVR